MMELLGVILLFITLCAGVVGFVDLIIMLVLLFIDRK